MKVLVGILTIILVLGFAGWVRADWTTRNYTLDMLELTGTSKNTYPDGSTGSEFVFLSLSGEAAALGPQTDIVILAGTYGEIDDIELQCTVVWDEKIANGVMTCMGAGVYVLTGWMEGKITSNSRGRNFSGKAGFSILTEDNSDVWVAQFSTIRGRVLKSTIR